MDEWKIKWLADEQEITADTKCSFCKKRRDQVERLIAGPDNVYICNECGDLYREHIERMAGPPISIEKFLRVCSSCGIRVPASHRYCYNCGFQFTQEAGCVKGRVSMTTVEKPSVVVPANWVPGPQQGQWTYKDYLAIPEDGCRYEVVDGVLYMSPSPGVEHQRIVKRIVAWLSRFVEQDELGEVFQSPLDVELSYRNIVQPDVFVLLNEHFDRITEARIIGAPDLVIEIASPSTARHDLSEKLWSYVHAGVPEYWIVTPGSKTVEVLVLDNGLYRSLGLFSESMVLSSRIMPNISVKVEWFFAS